MTIGNTGPISTIAQAKLRPIIQIPTSVTFLSTPQQLGLPAGWTILSNNGSQLRLCNSSDPIPVNTSRIIILKAQGVTVTPAQTFSGNINFGFNCLEKLIKTNFVAPLRKLCLIPLLINREIRHFWQMLN